jgi:hypothetical protein
MKIVGLQVVLLEEIISDIKIPKTIEKEKA